MGTYIKSLVKQQKEKKKPTKEITENEKQQQQIKKINSYVPSIYNWYVFIQSCATVREDSIARACSSLKSNLL